jgi:hypothetical protein
MDQADQFSHDVAVIGGCGRVGLMTDPYVTVDPALVPLDQVLDEADILTVATPHPDYRFVRTDKPVADVWHILDKELAS